MMISPHIVFILGAGASAQAGIPTMQNFLDKTDKIIQKLSYYSRLDDKIKDAYDDVIETRGFLNQIYHKANIDLDNIEHIYGALVMSSTFGGLGNWDRNKIEFKIKNLEYIILRTIEESMTLGNDIHNPVSPAPYHSFLFLLKNLIEKNPAIDISIITFNYDIAFEMAHFVGGPNLAPIRNFDYCLENSFRDFRTIKLLKLHGSINWGVFKGGVIQPCNVNDFRKSSDVLRKQNDLKENTYPIATEMERISGFEKVEKIAIIPPSFNKNYEYKGLNKVWVEAANQLSLADVIYISGFSLSNADSFFRYLFSIGTINNSKLKSLEVFNYNSTDKLNKETNQRYDDLIGQGFKNRFTYHNKTFAEMISYLNGNKSHSPINFIISP